MKTNRRLENNQDQEESEQTGQEGNIAMNFRFSNILSTEHITELCSIHQEKKKQRDKPIKI